MVKSKTTDRWVVEFTVGTVHYTLTADNFGNPKAPGYDLDFATGSENISFTLIKR